MIIQREFELFCDDANGEYGIAINNSKDYQFNAFWNGIGIFHDCFEHYFEGELKPFTGDNAYTIWGEVAAMGAALQYVTELGVYNRLVQRNWLGADSIFATVYDMFVDAEYNKDENGYLESMGFPLTKCPVKYQKPNDVDYNWQDYSSKGFRHVECPKEYKQDIKNTMRWGAKLANKLYFREMTGIIPLLDGFTKNIAAEDLWNYGTTKLNFKFKKENQNLEYAKIQFKINGDYTKWFNLDNINYLEDILDDIREN